MDEHGFRLIDIEAEKRIAQELGYEWQYDRWAETDKPLLCNGSKPEKEEWIPIGYYNGNDLPDIYIDSDYIVYIKILNPEYNCEVMM